ncbi:MAG: hypothetical protein ACRDJN_12845 [Chloroflexota bacterium]
MSTATSITFDPQATPRVHGELLEFRPGQWVRASLIAFVRAERPSGQPEAPDAPAAPAGDVRERAPNPSATADEARDNWPAILLVQAGGRDGLLFVGTSFSVRAINEALADLWLLGLPRPPSGLTGSR